MVKRTAEEIADDNERTNAMGLFNTAEAYWKSAVTLEAAKVDSGHAIDPVYMLYYHAIELYLKAFLRGHGLSVEELRSKFGHKTNLLVVKSEELGLPVDDEDREIYTMMGDTDVVIEARYIRTGPKT